MNSLAQPTITTQGGVFRLHCPSNTARKGGGIRKPITVFSDRSRRALMERFAATDWQALMDAGVPVLFLTLTLTPEYWGELRVCKKAVAAIERWLATLPGFQGGMVRREYGTKRGALHYHLIVLGLSRVDAGELRARWSRAVRYSPALDKPQFLRVDVDRAESIERVCKYLCKYVSKAAWEGAIRDGGPPVSTGDTGTDSPLALSKAQIATEEADANLSDSHTGTRYWSFFGPWPMADEQVLPVPDGLTPRQYAARVRRTFRKWRVTAERAAIRKRMGLESYEAEIAANSWVSCGMRASVLNKGRAAVEVEVSKFAKRQGWLKSGGGFVLFLSPAMMGKIVNNAKDAAGWFVATPAEEGVIAWA